MLAHEKYSPLQMANNLHTTIANISQQLRLLEAANLVKKEKIPNRDRGKPRSLFSLKKDYAYLILTVSDFADKKLIELSDTSKLLVKSLFVENVKMHFPISKMLVNILEHLDTISSLSMHEEHRKVIFLISSNNVSDTTKKLSKFLLNKTIHDSEISSEIISLDKFEQLRKQKKGPFSDSTRLILLHDSKSLTKIARW